MIISTINNKIAVIPPIYEKVTAEIIGGFVTISQKKQILTCDLVFSYELPDGKVLSPGTHKLLVSGDSGLQAWSTNVYTLYDKEFALLPIEFVIGVISLSQTPEEFE